MGDNAPNPLSLADATAAPLRVALRRFPRRRQVWNISPLTLADMGMYERNGGRYGTLRPRDAVWLLWLSLRKLHDVSLPDVVRLLRRRRASSRLMDAFFAVNEAAFNIPDAAKGSAKGDAKAMDMSSLLRSLASGLHFTPREVGDMTAAQVMAMIDWQKRLHFKTRAEAEAYLREIGYSE